MRLATYLATHDLREEQNWRETSLDMQVAKSEMEGKLSHMAKMCKEMNCDRWYNIKDRSDKQVYNTKINADI